MKKTFKINLISSFGIIAILGCNNQFLQSKGVNIKDTAGNNWFFKEENITCVNYLDSDGNNLFCDASAIITDIAGNKEVVSYYDHPCSHIFWGFSNDVICSAALELNRINNY